MTRMATVVAEVDKKRMLYRISSESLRVKFRAIDDNLIQSVVQHRAAIQEAAKRPIERFDFESDGSVLIKTADLEWKLALYFLRYGLVAAKDGGFQLPLAVCNAYSLASFLAFLAAFFSFGFKTGFFLSSLLFFCSLLMIVFQMWVRGI